MCTMNKSKRKKERAVGHVRHPVLSYNFLCLAKIFCSIVREKEDEGCRTITTEYRKQGEEGRRGDADHGLI